MGRLCYAAQRQETGTQTHKMTALAEFERLEAPAIWHASPDAQRRDVILSIGDATLTITDHRDIAIAHWSLAAIERINPGRRPAVFAPGIDAPERIELSDDTMIRAIDKVRRAVARARPQPGRLRARLIGAVCLAIAAIAVLWLPGALIRYTASIVPDVSRDALGRSLLAEVTRVSGAPCAVPGGDAALQALSARLGDQTLAHLVVLPAGVTTTAHLPGGYLLVNRSVVEDHESPAVVAGYLLAETERAARLDPLEALLNHAGVVAALRLLTTGNLPEGQLSAYAESLLTAPQSDPAPGPLLARFAAARVPSTPYAFAVDISGERTLPLIEADPISPATAPRILSDGSWVALQGICGG